MDAGEPKFLPLTQVQRIHRRSLEEHGGLDGVRDPGAVESALASAENTWFYGGGDVFDENALYDAMIAIARREFDKAGLAALLRTQFPKA